MAERWDITFPVGQDQALTWNLTSTPTDITDWNLQLSVRQREDLPVLFSLTVGDGLIVLNPTAGTVLIFFKSELTKDLTPAPYVYDLWRMDPDNIQQLTYGHLNLLRRVVPPVAVGTKR